MYRKGKSVDVSPDRRYLHLIARTFQAHILLADQFFSPSLLLAERIERGLIPLEGRSGTVLFHQR